MKLEKFKSGIFVNQGDYKTFKPVLINEVWEWQNAEINTLLEEASMELGGLNSFADLIESVSK